MTAAPRATWPVCECGRHLSRPDAKTCRACIREAARHRADLIVELYNQGAPYRTIAERLGLGGGTLGADMARLRAAGRIGYRNQVQCQ